MKKVLMGVIAVVFAVGAAYAQNGNPCPSDKEYQLNIIGVPKDKSASMTGNQGHRIFVPLQSGPDLEVPRQVKIFMTGDTAPGDADGDGYQLDCGNSFYPSDANATDDNEATLVVPCEPIAVGDPGLCFDVYATGLGTPGGNANVDVVCEFDDTCDGCDIEDDINNSGDTCDTGNVDFSVARGNGKPVREDITNVFRAEGCIDADTTDLLACGDDPADIIFDNVWIFNLPQLLSYYWDYDNNGLKVMQLRFCDSDVCGSVTAGGD